MDLTIQNFENNLGKLDENMQEKVIDLIEQNPQEVLEGLANAFGVSLVTEEGVTTGPDTFGEETDRVPSDEEEPPFAADPRKYGDPGTFEEMPQDPPFAADPRQTAEDNPVGPDNPDNPVGPDNPDNPVGPDNPPFAADPRQTASMYGVGKPEEGMDSPYPVEVGTLGDDTVSGVGPPLIPVKKQMQALNLGQAVERSDQSTEIVPSQEELLLGMSQPAEGEETTGEIAVEGADTSGVADDIPIKSSEGAFVLNAEAVTFAGRMDIRKMIEEAAESLERQGKRVNIGNIKDPSAQTTGTEDVLISNGEVIISKAMAEEIGGDRLSKINERGKAATEQKIQEQQAQEQQGTPQKTIPVRAT